MKTKRCIHKIKNDCNQKTTFILLCGKKSNKKGYRNIPLTNITSEVTIIDFQINTILDNYNDGEIILISGFEHDRLVSHVHKKQYRNVRIAENKNYDNSNIVDAWKFALNIAITEDTYIIHGDRIFSASSIVSPKVKNSHVITHDYNKNNYDLGILAKENRFINMSYGLPNVWSEIFFISKSDFNIARDALNDYKKRKIYTIESFINELSQKTKISVVNKEPSDIQTLKDIK